MLRKTLLAACFQVRSLVPDGPAYAPSGDGVRSVSTQTEKPGARAETTAGP